MPGRQLPLTLAVAHHIARWAAALCFIYESGNLRAAAERFRRHHPLLVEFASKRLDKFVRYWGAAGFDDQGELRKSPPHGRPPILSEKDVRRAADAIAAGTTKGGVPRHFRSLAEAFAKSPTLKRLQKRRKGNLGKPVSLSTIMDAIKGAALGLHKVKPENLPFFTPDDKAQRVRVAQWLLSKPSSYLEQMVYWDHTAFGVAEASFRDAVWAARASGRPVEYSEQHRKAAKFISTGCLCGLSLNKGTIGPFSNAPPGTYKVLTSPPYQNQG